MIESEALLRNWGLNRFAKGTGTETRPESVSGAAYTRVNIVVEEPSIKYRLVL